MKMMMLSLIAVTFAQTALASVGGSTLPMDRYGTGATNSTYPNCVQCGVKTLQPEINTLIREMMGNTQVADATSKAISNVNDSMGFATKCDNFATDAEMGAWGDIIVAEFKKNNSPYLVTGAADLYAACPKYKSLNATGKQAVWVMIMSAMAHLESSCNKSATAKGPNGSLIGLLQLHVGAEQKYAPNCKKGDGNSSEGTFRCGMSMLNLQLRKREALFARASYWDVLRPQAKMQKYKKIQSALGKLSICK